MLEFCLFTTLKFNYNKLLINNYKYIFLIILDVYMFYKIFITPKTNQMKFSGNK